MRASACLIPLAVAQDLFLSRPEEKVDVIVIGAGWAGMSAAHHLAQNNVNFLVLEASNRTGGRTHAFEFGDPSVGKFVFEQGSNWVCGSGLQRTDSASPSVRTNPMLDLAQKEGLQTYFIPGATDGNMSNYFAVYDEYGNRADMDGELRRKANDALECLNRTASSANKKVTVRDGLTSCGWKPSTNAEWAMDWALASDTAGVLARHYALNGFAPDPTYDWWGPDDWFVVDQHPRGYARLIDAMVRDTVPEGDSRVVFDAWVSNIAWGSKGVTITTKDGRTFKAKHAISTVSLGVLRKHHKELFTPNLPKKQAKVLMDNKRTMANLTHVLIQFPSVWWDNTLPAWVSANTGGDGSKGNFTAWHNLNVEGQIPGSNTLLSFIGEPEATQYGLVPEAELLALLMERLRAQNPGKTLPEGTTAWLKNWGNDELTYGAYPWAEPGVDYSPQWKKPLKSGKKSIVQFAGEATCGELGGYTHGAKESGTQAAAKYLYQFENGPNPAKDDALHLCSFYYYQ